MKSLCFGLVGVALLVWSFSMMTVEACDVVHVAKCVASLLGGCACCSWALALVIMPDDLP